MRFKDKVAIVTGSTSGIGKATVEQFVAEGGCVTIIGLNPQAGREIEKQLNDAASRQGCGGALFCRTDVSKSAEVQAAVKATVDRWGKIDILVNNAAMMTFKPIVDLDESDWDRVLSVNLKGPFLFCKYCIPHMRRGSAIVNVSSVHADATEPHVLPYAASKGGMEAFTRGLCVEYDDQGIRANALRPGSVDTKMLWSNPNLASGAENVVPIELGEPNQLAAAILFLASDAASFINGAVLNVDGGRLAFLGGHPETQHASAIAPAHVHGSA
jgi:glucose 1-dehydrogenase